MCIEILLKGFTSNCVRRRKNALLIQIGVEIVWYNIDYRELMDLEMHSPQILQGWMTLSPTLLAKERGLGRTP